MRGLSGYRSFCTMSLSSRVNAAACSSVSSRFMARIWGFSQSTEGRFGNGKLYTGVTLGKQRRGGLSEWHIEQVIANTISDAARGRSRGTYWTHRERFSRCRILIAQRYDFYAMVPCGVIAVCALAALPPVSTTCQCHLAPMAAPSTAPRPAPRIVLPAGEFV